MARTGLYKSEVKKARDALLAQKKHPSVDAVRIALGNTGSKTTIHKYLKELEGEDGGGTKVAISEALQDLVSRLAAQLQEDANRQIDTIQAQAAEQARQQAGVLAVAQEELALATSRLQAANQAMEQESAAHNTTRGVLHAESIARHTAEARGAGLAERLTENEAHRASLEEKHQHAREALEHYRQSVKEQRDQDARRHEQQVQQLQAEMRQLQQTLIVKQEDITRVNQEAARLVANLSHAQKALLDEQSRAHQLAQRLEQLLLAEQRCKALERDVADRDALATDLKGQLEQVTQRAAAIDQETHALELALAAAQAKLEANQALGAELRAYMAADKKAGKVVGGKGASGITSED